jgi:hypothetical protein
MLAASSVLRRRPRWVAAWVDVDDELWHVDGRFDS